MRNLWKTAFSWHFDKILSHSFRILLHRKTKSWSNNWVWFFLEFSLPTNFKIEMSFVTKPANLEQNEAKIWIYWSKMCIKLILNVCECLSSFGVIFFIIRSGIVMFSCWVWLIKELMGSNHQTANSKSKIFFNEDLLWFLFQLANWEEKKPDLDQ